LDSWIERQDLSDQDLANLEDKIADFEVEENEEVEEAVGE